MSVAALLLALPDRLQERALDCAHGGLQPRLLALHRLRDALLENTLPAEGSLPWPEPPLGEDLLAALREEELPSRCAREPWLVAEVLVALVDAADAFELSLRRRMARGPGSLFEGLLAPTGERTGRYAHEHGRVLYARQGVPLPRFTELRAQRAREVEFVRSSLGATLWRPRLRALLGFAEQPSPSCSAPPARDPPLSASSALFSRRELLAMREEAQRLEADKELAQALASLREEPPAPALPRGPTLEGLHHAADLARMLPSEALLLRHPKLRWLWHARRTEGALLAYRPADAHREEAPPPSPPAPRGRSILAVLPADLGERALAQVRGLLLVLLAEQLDQGRPTPRLLAFRGVQWCTTPTLAVDLDLRDLLRQLSPPEHAAYRTAACQSLASYVSSIDKGSELLLVLDPRALEAALTTEALRVLTRAPQLRLTVVLGAAPVPEFARRSERLVRLAAPLEETRARDDAARTQ